MRLLSYSLGGEVRGGVAHDGLVVDLARLMGDAGVELREPSVRSFLEAGVPARARLTEVFGRPGAIAKRVVAETPDIRLEAPVPDASKILAVARNYNDHIVEGGGEPVGTHGRIPLIFPKLPSCLIGTGAAVRLPSFSRTVDWEIELAVVIGTRAADVAPDESLEHVAGYAVFNDVSARTMDHPGADLDDPAREWFDFINGKNCDTFAPMGPYLVTADEVPDPQDLGIKLSVNGSVRQDSTTAEMIFGVADIVSFASRLCTLLPGDVIATGTPAGCGDATGTYLRGGDVVEASIDGLGVLTTPVIGCDG